MKLELYKAYKTRAGNKAVVNHAMDNNTVMAFHFQKTNAGTIYPVLVYHSIKNGKVWSGDKEDGGYDIISEWVEPRTGTFWVNVYDGNVGVGVISGPYATKQDADREKDRNNGRIALKRVRWAEGDEE